ncbi:unnamed protein product [Peniophora sp. CBMAI 1063]|nr:unnamed protein product [Peniophora sp. CBMAI 1063]
MAGPVLANHLPPLDDTMGALYIGVLVSALLYGVSFLQTVYYFFSSRNDWIGLKFLVGVVSVLDTIHQGMITHAAYIYMITNFMNPSTLDTVVWTLIAETLINALLALCVQAFFVWRIYTLHRDGLRLPVLLGLLSLTRFCLIATWVGKSARLRTWVNLSSLKNLSQSATVITLVSECSIAAALLYLMYKARSSASSSHSPELMKYILNTGLLTSIDALCLVIAYAARPDAMISIAFFFVLGRLYSNSLLATLNARGKPSSLKMIHLKIDSESRASSSFVLSDVTADYKFSYVGNECYAERSAREVWDTELGVVLDESSR